jgi:Polymerase beta, Nucleotidyltransferase/Winged helix-turn-helix DNA-binding
MWYIYTKLDMIQISPPLLQSLGKRGRLKVLDILVTYPARAFTINELAREAGVPAMTCWRCVREFEAMGMVTVDTVGKAFAVRLNGDSGVVKDLKRSRLGDFQRDAAVKFAGYLRGLEGVVGCYLFGSVSEATQGPASDVDVAVVYDPIKINRSALEQACAAETVRIQQSTGARIVPFYITQGELGQNSLPAVNNILAGEDLWKSGH